ncbi:zinc transporter ZIP14-like [Lingula anatina]|uniref:Zinc transporter ZIP14-like n=1 Tax=Lingula anatina TaxID=7574 RepID=A0A1S3IGN3_LINAN|nr:zinc transporter ZIP14-like [Lingula anatina]|eukprot:XP_013397298.1 zinc transporter ZIP14-like [Lingula anatina]
MVILTHISVFVYLVATATFCQGISKDDFFVRNLMSKYGSNDTLSVDQLSSLLEALKDGGDQNLADSHGATSDNGDHACYVNPDTDSIPSASEACLKEKCLTAEEIVSFHSLPNRSTINSVTLKKISPTLLYQAQNKKCFIPRLAKSSKSKKPTKGEVWGYGILFVTITNICALLGVLLVPFMNKFFYKKLLIFMVALAVGTLAGSALFFLIPDSFGLAEYDEEGAYIWKGLTVLGGIYLFFILEYTMKAIMYRKEKKKERRRTYEEIATLASVQTHTHVEVDPELKVPPEMKEGAAKYGIMQGNESSADLLDDNGREEGEENDACNVSCKYICIHIYISNSKPISFRFGSTQEIWGLHGVFNFGKSYKWFNKLF